MGEKDKEKRAERKHEEKENENLLKLEQIIAADAGGWYRVERLLGKGGFGEVYKVCLLKDEDKTFAMKVEPVKNSQGNMLRLKVEVLVFRTIAAASDSDVDKSHFLKMYDKGRTHRFKYYMMDLIWLSLHDVVAKVLKAPLSSHAKINIARQTLTSIEALHKLGFLHRDIKSSNFAVGMPPKDNMIYMLDFGIAKPFKDERGRVRMARARVPFMGTTRYASIRSLERKEQSRRDDLEVWMYMMLELYDKQNLWWRDDCKNTDKVIKDKKELVKSCRTLLAKSILNMPNSYCDIIDTIRKMKYEDPGDFKLLNFMLSKIVQDEKINESLPLDWIGKTFEEPTQDTSKKADCRGDQSPENVKKRSRKKESKMKQRSKDIAELGDTELLKEIRRERKKHGIKARTTDDDEDSEDDDDDYSDRTEEKRRRRKKRKGRKKRSRERDSLNYSDREYRDASYRDEERRRRRGSGEKRRGSASKKKKHNEHGEKVARIPEPKETVEDKDRDRKKPKGEKTVEVKEKQTEKTVDNEQKKKEKGKSAEPSPAAKPGSAEPAKKSKEAINKETVDAKQKGGSNEARPVKKEPTDIKKK